MITVAAARSAAAKRLASKSPAWATGRWEAPVLTVALHPPSEREMLADQRAAEAWAGEWREQGSRSSSTGTHVEWETRSWRSIGRQEVPVRLVLETPEDVAALVRGETGPEYRRLAGRVRTLRDMLERPSTAGAVLAVADDAGGFESAARDRTDALAAAIRRHAATLTAYSDEEFDTVVAVARWLLDNPVADMRPRELPIRGVDSKWFGTHRAVLTALVESVGGSVGIVDADPLLRIRLLEPALAHGGPTDFAAPLPELDRMSFAPDVAFVFENKESVLAMPEMDGAVVIHGSGYAVDRLGQIGWLHNLPIIYWGDLDSHGFAILNELRSVHPTVTSVLMDDETLLAHRDLWVPEPKPTRGEFSRLTASESAALARLRDEGDVRLEQERIPWSTAIAALTTEVQNARSSQRIERLRTTFDIPESD